MIKFFLFKSSLFFLIIVLIGGCLDVEELLQPAIVNANQKFNVKMRVKMTPRQNRENAHIVLALLVPKSWHAATNTKITYVSTKGSGYFVTVPKLSNVLWAEAIMNGVGMGNNKIKDLEWVPFWTC